jgi:alanine racemase
LRILTRFTEGGTQMMAPAELEIDLAAVAANWRKLAAMHAGATGAAVKADAYGLGAARVAPALYEAGCRHFFVAHLTEGLELAPLLPGGARPGGGRPGFMLAVLHGILPGEEAELAAHGLVPVLTNLGDVERWRAEARRQGRRLPAILHADSGMNRLALSPAELAVLSGNGELLEGIELKLVMSHLISSELPEAPSNAEQLRRFQALRRQFPMVKASLANSSGMFLGPEFLADVTRPGAALYGLNPTPEQKNPMRAVARLSARILSVREIAPGETVGYNATWTATRPSRIATVAAGYADGILRSLSGSATARFDGKPVPLVGRVSMDLATFDVTDQPEAVPGKTLELLGPEHDADALAREAGTNGYEILTSLGRRYRRRYLGETQSL